jgi:anaerobic magnesium-protoporphyrin IX monomethyl ester cyclase
MTSVLLIYPFFKASRDRSIFRFPPLGVGYLAACLQETGHEVHLLDCTFLERSEALSAAEATCAEVVGIYCMVTMLDDCLWFARHLRGNCKLIVAGGPLPTCDPLPFLEHFDVVVLGEGEQTMKELLRAYEHGSNFSTIPGIAYRNSTASSEKDEEKITFTQDRPFEKDLDRIPFPARVLLPNKQYIRYGKKKYGYSITTVMSTRGCPYRCEFCSNVVFGGSYRERSPENVIDEIETALGLGYDRISFADDVFTLNCRRVLNVCKEIRRRGLRFQWECLGRVDTLDYSTALEMNKAGCKRVYFGIESGDDQILKLMNKKITTDQARCAVEAAHRAGLETGAFFILFYPGETDETVLSTLRFATSLPLDYLGLSMPYPLPGTALYDRVKQQITREWRSGESLFGSHVLIYDSDFSEAKMWLGIIKGHVQFRMKRRLGKLAPLFLSLFEKPTDVLLRLMR